jgi:hypothetical protein
MGILRAARLQRRLFNVFDGFVSHPSNCASSVSLINRLSTAASSHSLGILGTPLYDWKFIIGY